MKKKTNNVWAWDMHVPSDGSMPTCIFTPWNELPRREKIKRTINTLIAIACILYGFYKATVTVGEFVVKLFAKGCDFAEKCKAKLHQFHVVMTDMAAADDASEYVMPEKEYRRHSSESEEEDKTSTPSAVKIDGATTRGSNLAFTVPGFVCTDRSAEE